MRLHAMENLNVCVPVQWVVDRVYFFDVQRGVKSQS
jgi:hypothetical protein